MRALPGLPLLYAGSILFAFLAWLWFESQSYAFEIQAAKILGYPEAGRAED